MRSASEVGIADPFYRGQNRVLRDESIRGVCSALGLAVNPGLLAPIQLGTEHVSRCIGNILSGATLNLDT